MADEPLPPDVVPDVAPEPGGEVSEQMRVRLGKRAAMLADGIDPYPLHVPRTHAIADLVERYDAATLGPDAHTGDRVAVAGRVVFVRNGGKLCFAVLREGAGAEIQVMLSLAVVGEDALERFKALVDIGDHIAVCGEVITSRRGELSVEASEWVMAAKTLRPLPNEYRPLSDEARVRLRYVDMIVRPESRAMVRRKAAVLRALRSTLDSQGFLEVETPVLQLTNGGAAARPFRTRLNAFDQDMLLRIALELDLKKAMVGGVDRVYEIGKTFRNEGIDSTHAAEFSMLEAYQAYGDYDSMAELLHDLVVAAAEAIGSTVIRLRDGSETDLAKPWRHASVHELAAGATQEDVPVDISTADARALATRHGVAFRPDWSAGEIVLEIYEKLVEHTLLTPTLVRDYPVDVRPLAKAHRVQHGLTEAFDLVVNGVELGVAYSELNDPVVQRERLTEQSLRAAKGDPEAMDLDEEFLRALEFGMPPAGGMGMGVDRLVMLLTGVGIRESILFPLLRPE